MKILAFDTAVMGCSVAVVDTASGQSWSDSMVTERKQAEILVPMIEAVMKQASAAFTDIERIVVTVGPESFTGVRIGLATARAMALASSKPLVGVSTLQVLASQVHVDGGQQVLAVIDTKRDDFYGEVFDPSGVSMGAARIWNAEEVALARQNPQIVIAEGNPDIIALTHLGAKASLTDMMPDPIYLRGAEVSSPKRVAPVAI